MKIYFCKEVHANLITSLSNFIKEILLFDKIMCYENIIK